jgi:hypothetical protein
VSELLIERLHGEHRVTLAAFGSRRDGSKRLDAELHIDPDGAWHVMFVVRKWTFGHDQAPLLKVCAGLAAAVREYNS